MNLLAVAAILQGAMLVLVALLTYWHSKYMARMFEKIEAAHTAIFLAVESRKA